MTRAYTHGWNVEHVHTHTHTHTHTCMHTHTHMHTHAACMMHAVSELDTSGLASMTHVHVCNIIWSHVYKLS